LKKKNIDKSISVDRQDFINALKKVSPGVSTKDLIKEYACVQLSQNMISSFSERVIVSYPFALIGIECLVDHSILSNMLDKINSINVNLSLTDKELILSTEKIQSGIAIIDGEHPPVNLPNEWSDFPEELMTALQFCSFSISKDMTIPSATCIHIHGDKVLSTDTKRVTQFEMKEKSPFDFHVPYVVFKNLSGYKFVKMAKDNNLIHFLEDNGAIFSFYQMSLDREISPETAKKFFDVKGVEVEFPQDFLKVIDRASVMTEGLIELDFVVDVHLEDNKFKVSSRKESGWFEEVGDIVYSWEPVTFRASAPFLMNILNKTKKATIGEMCLFSGDNFNHVMVLVNQ
jgi:hypothetical protein